ncbi:MAG: hypothetical protein EOL86_02285 [Deltaproteobacteria bacterium]|nr:hypothetical protein [Deltaproteobacteria bacterium]
MTWTTPADIRARVRALWDRGTILAGLIGADHPFPLRLPLKRPGSEELTARFDEVRAWIRDLRAMPHCRLETKDYRHRVLGTNALPQAMWIDTPDAAIRLIGKTREAARFLDLHARTEHLPTLRPWLVKRPLRALDLAGDWPRLLAFVDWMRHNPRPGIYVRLIDLPGLDTKFIETHRGVLAELLELALPPEAIDHAITGSAHFARRHGFLDKPRRIRCRVLDPAHSPLSIGGTPDLTMDHEHFARVPWRVDRVFITENEINFLAFPSMPDSLVIFGGGYGFEMLDGLHFLERAQVFYWGDIDTHGFAILDELRLSCPWAQSFLMDRDTLMAFEAQWGEEHTQTKRDLRRLTPEEGDLYDDLRDNRIRPRLRLEQERIGFTWARQALDRLVHP